MSRADVLVTHHSLHAPEASRAAFGFAIVLALIAAIALFSSRGGAQAPSDEIAQYGD